MAFDTQDKRESAMCLIEGIPLADGAIDNQPDALHLMGLYRGYTLALTVAVQLSRLAFTLTVRQGMETTGTVRQRFGKTGVVRQKLEI